MKPTFTHWLRTGYALRINLRTGFLLVAHYSKKSSLQRNSFLELNRQPVTHNMASVRAQHPFRCALVTHRFRTVCPFRTGCALVSIHHDFVNWQINNVNATWHCALVTHCCGNMRTGFAPKSPSSFCGAAKSFTHWSYALVPVRRIEP